MTTVAPSEQATATATATADEILRRLLTTEEGRRDPYPLYRALRDTAPFYRSGLDGCWYASGYDHCKAVLVDPRAGRSAGQMAARLGQNPEMMQRFARRSRHTMLFQNPPEHTRLRGLVSRAFTPKRMAALASGIASLTEPLLDEMAAAGEVDVMAALAFPLPVAVIGALVGVPPDEREQFRPLTRAIMALSEPDAPAESLAAADRAAKYQDAYFSDL
ncbi:MAG: cytochrome P450, partial [Acidimicrobiia bacterium]